MNELFWEVTQKDRVAGYCRSEDIYRCLFCDYETEEGYIFKREDIFVDAKKQMMLHIEEVHGGVLSYLTSLDKKVSGLSAQQSNIIRLFYEGLSDHDIQKQLGIGSISTVRNHRHALKEKERQAKTMATIFDVLSQTTDDKKISVKPHPTATMIDDRYNITTEDREKVKKAYKEKVAKEVIESGVYQIRNMFNGKIYLGTARDIKKLEGLKFQLNTRSFTNSRLQEDWLALGEENFAIEVLESFPEDENTEDVTKKLSELKQKWKETLQPFGDRGYHRKSRRA